MSKFSVHKAEDGQFYGKFVSGSDHVWNTPTQYNVKRSAIKAIASLARHFQMFIFQFDDECGSKPVTKTVLLEGNKIVKIEILQDAKSGKRTR